MMIPKKRGSFADGFTRVEMFVIISAVLLVLVFAGVFFYNSRIHADEARVQADLTTIAAALEQYYQDHGSYPEIGGWTGASTDPGTPTWPILQSRLSPYISRLPTPPWPSHVDENNSLVGAYSYIHPDKGHGIAIMFYDKRTDRDTSCIYIYDGYYLSGGTPHGETAGTIYDGGYNPNVVDGIASAHGRIELRPLDDCHTRGVSAFTY